MSPRNCTLLECKTISPSPTDFFLIALWVSYNRSCGLDFMVAVLKKITKGVVYLVLAEPQEFFWINLMNKTENAAQAAGETTNTKFTLMFTLSYLSLHLCLLSATLIAPRVTSSPGTFWWNVNIKAFWMSWFVRDPFVPLTFISVYLGMLTLWFLLKALNTYLLENLS